MRPRYIPVAGATAGGYGDAGGDAARGDVRRPPAGAGEP
jgi:hypothetical protein